MADISKITLPNGTTYNIKDATARAQVAGGVHYLGKTTTALTDGATTSPITIGDESITPSNGDMVIYNAKEFIWDGEKWNEFGDMSNLGTLAYQNSASGTFTPSGSVSQPTFTGASSTFTGNFTPSGTVTITKGTGTANYTPTGTVSRPTFTGTSTTSTGTFTPSGSVTISTGTGTANYTPQGTVSAPTISVGTAGSTTTINNATAKQVVGAVVTNSSMPLEPGAPEITYCSVANETLTLYKIGYTETASINTSNVTVKTGDATYTASQPTFTGTGANLVGTFTGTSGNVSVSGTPKGNVSQPTFTGDGAELKGSFSGTQGSVSVSGTPNGSVSQPTFSGNSGTVTVS